MRYEDYKYLPSETQCGVCGQEKCLHYEYVEDIMTSFEWAEVSCSGFELELPQSSSPVIPGMGPDQATVTNENGAKQSDIPYAYHLVPALALAKVAEVLHAGSKKYGVNNWKGIPAAEHLNHGVAHDYAFLAGDTSDEHLAHAATRALMALQLFLEKDHAE